MPIGGARTGLLGSGVAIPDSAISQYRIDEGSGSTISDSLGSESDGSINGATWMSDSSATGGQVLDFDGSNDNVQLSQPSWVSLNNKVTIAVTVDWDSIQTNQDILDIGDVNNDIYISAGTPFESGSGGDLGVFVRQGSTSNNLSSTNEWQTDTKTRLAIRVDWETVDAETYINSTQVAYDGSNNPLAQGTNQLASADDRAFADCSLDNFVVYDGLLTQSEIEQDYNAQPWV